MQYRCSTDRSVHEYIVDRYVCAGHALLGTLLISKPEEHSCTRTYPYLPWLQV